MKFKGLDKDGVVVYETEFDYARQNLCCGAVDLYKYFNPMPVIEIGGTPYEKDIILTIRDPRECVENKRIRKISRWMIE